MTIKPQKSTTVVWFLAWIFAFAGIYIIAREPLTSTGAVSSSAVSGTMLIAISLCVIIETFSAAFSTYYLDYEGITQKCFFLTRHFYWKDFKFIGIHEIAGVSDAPRSCHIRCSTVPLPKNLTAKELEKKTHWPPSKTITIEWRYKGGDEFYREFLSYCGGERDIRD